MVSLASVIPAKVDHGIGRGAAQRDFVAAGAGIEHKTVTRAVGSEDYGVVTSTKLDFVAAGIRACLYSCNTEL